MSARDAMAGFINLIDKRCLHFNVFIQAQKAEMEEQARKLYVFIVIRSRACCYLKIILKFFRMT